MSRRKDVFNSPEYRHIEENLDDILKELEGDEETRNMTMPEEWDKDFREILEKVNEENRQRHRKKLRRTIAAAAAVLIVSVPVIGFVGTETVEGDGIMELFENVVSFNGKRYQMTGTNEDGLSFNPSDLDTAVIVADNIMELNEKIEKELKHPFYKVKWIPEDFTIKEVVYNKEYNSLNLEFCKDNKYIYVSELFITDPTMGSNVMQDSKEGTVINHNMGISIDIYKSEADEGLSFSIMNSNAKFDCYMETTLDECKTLAENIVFE